MITGKESSLTLLTARAHELAYANDIQGVRAIMAVVEAKLNETRTDAEERPRLVDDEVKMDLRYKMGFIAGLKYVLALPERGREIIENLPEQGEMK